MEDIFLGLIVGALLASSFYWWMLPFHDVKIMNKTAKEQWEKDCRDNSGAPPTMPPDHWEVR